MKTISRPGRRSDPGRESPRPLPRQGGPAATRPGGAGVSRAEAARASTQKALLVHRLHALAALFHRRWATPILAELQANPLMGGGAKFITLVHRLGLSPASLSATLEDLIAQDLVMRNPGYGHPMRPEYMLTEDGHAVAPRCAALMETLRSLGAEAVSLRKWSMPLVLALASGAERFSELRGLIPSITPRALALALKDLAAAGLATRHVTRGFPPATVYRLTRSGRRVAPLLAHLRADLVRM